MSVTGVRRAKAALSSGCKPHPADEAISLGLRWWIASPAIMGAGDARAAMTLAGTYDPLILAETGRPWLRAGRSHGTSTWYEKAKKFGSAEALGQVPAAERQLVPRPAALRQPALERPAVWRRGRLGVLHRTLVGRLDLLTRRPHAGREVAIEAFALTMMTAHDTQLRNPKEARAAIGAGKSDPWRSSRHNGRGAIAPAGSNRSSR